MNEYVDIKTLAGFLGMAKGTLNNKSKSIIGRVKIGRGVRYHMPTIRKTIEEGKSIFKESEE